MNNLSPAMLAQLFAQESNDPFLTLMTLSHSTFAAPIRLVNNTQNIISRGETYSSFPATITLPVDDGEKARGVAIEFDNVSLELLDEIRSVNSSEQIQVKLEMVLASIPNEVQMSLEELKIGAVSYNKSRIKADLIIDNFLSTELTSERYTPTVYNGLF